MRPSRRGNAAQPRGAELTVMEVLRWFGFFCLALLVIVFAIFWIQGRPFPIHF
jgi:hypothetical protein